MIAIKQILCSTDFSEASLEGLKYGVQMAKQFGARLTVAHVVPLIPPLPSDPNFVFKVPEYERALHQDAQRKIEKILKDLEPQGIVAKSVLGHGDPGEEIVRLAADEGADLIVISTHGATGWRHLLFGSVAEKVVRLASCPVLSVHGPRP
jgi:nucleotide-binding universal stress UspA family protein